MATMTRWDPFQDLRSAQDELDQMSPMLAHALGQRAQQGSGQATTTAWAPAQVQAEQIEASFDNGVLQIMVPKMEEAKPKRIQVRPGGQREAVAGTAPAAN
jgi:hypothetical protein